MILKEFTLEEALAEMSDIRKCDFSKDLKDYSCDFLLLSLGFERRAVSVAEMLSQINFVCDETIVFNYSTNENDNVKNKLTLEKFIKKISGGFLNLNVDSSSFTEILVKSIEDKIKEKGTVKVLLDISACSSRLMLILLKNLFELDVDLKIIYTEASLYYPLFQDYEKTPEIFKKRDEIGITQGVDKVVLSQEFVGDNMDNSPEFVIAFPTFKADRTQTILLEIDEGIFSEQKKRMVWIVGQPHMEEPHKSQRIKMMRGINDIFDQEDAPPSYEISTLFYKETVSIIEKIYREKASEYHINIATLGSKMQSLGIAVFCFIRPEASVYFSVPSRYNPGRYSDGVKDHWIIEFGSTKILQELFNKIDTIQIVA